MSQTNTSSPFLPLPDGIVIASIHVEMGSVVVHIACHLPTALCPVCGQPSERIHGAYVRTVADLPCGGRRVILKLSGRKFVCRTASCPRRIFTERLSELVLSYARMTNRLSETFQTLGFATCGELGERLAPKLGMQVSGPTLLRRMRTRACPEPSSVRILGIDDWSWKKGVTYGTILVDLESRKPIELLPDRTASTRGEPGYAAIQKWSSSAAIEVGITQRQPKRGHLKLSRLPIAATSCRTCVRGSKR